MIEVASEADCEMTMGGATHYLGRLTVALRFFSLIAVISVCGLRAPVQASGSPQQSSSEVFQASQIEQARSLFEAGHYKDIVTLLKTVDRPDAEALIWLG